MTANIEPNHGSNIDWTTKRVLVTGAAGFIGSHLTERLVQLGAKTRAMVHYNALGKRGWLGQSSHQDDIEFIAGDIADFDSVKTAMAECDIVFHLAALIAIPYSYVAPRSYVRTNVEGTLNVVQAARELGTERVLHTSTSEVYGTAQYVPIDEKHPLQGQSPYSASKIGADKIAESFHLSFDVPVVTIRPFNTFGPRQSARAVIPTIITQCLAGKNISLGNLAPTRDLNFVANTVDGYLAGAASKDAIGRAVNLGTGQEISIGDLANLIIELTNSKSTVETDPQRLRPQKSEVDRLLACNALAKELMQWTPRFTLREGLEQTIAWLEKNMELYRPDEYTI